MEETLYNLEELDLIKIKLMLPTLFGTLQGFQYFYEKVSIDLTFFFLYFFNNRISFLFL